MREEPDHASAELPTEVLDPCELLLEHLRTLTSRHAYLLKLVDLLPMLATAAQSKERYEREAAAAEARLEVLAQQEAEEQAAHEQAQAARRTEGERTARAIADQLNVEQRHLDVLLGQVSETEAKLDQLMALQEQARRTLGVA